MLLSCSIALPILKTVSLQWCVCMAIKEWAKIEQSCAQVPFYLQGQMPHPSRPCGTFWRGEEATWTRGFVTSETLLAVMSWVLRSAPPRPLISDSIYILACLVSVLDRDQSMFSTSHFQSGSNCIRIWLLGSRTSSELLFNLLAESRGEEQALSCVSAIHALWEVVHRYPEGTIPQPEDF